MKTAFMRAALSLLLFGCGRSNSHLQKEVVGTWVLDSRANFKMTLSPDGSFVSHWATTNTSLAYQGTWKVQNGSMIATPTNCIAQGLTNFERVGTVESYAIIRADSTGLVYSNNNQIVSFRRE
jgi:hypothetical protein